MKAPIKYSLIALLLSGGLIAQEPDEPKLETEKAEEEKEKTIAELTEDSDLMNGLLNFYRDRKTGEVRLLLTAENLNNEYLYFSYAENGVADAGWLTRGSYQISTAKVFEIRRFYDKIEFVEKNTNFYFDSGKAIARAADANITDSVFFQEKIEKEDEETGAILLKVDGLFLAESFYKISPLPNPEKKPHESFSIGTLSKDKSKIREIKNYPENSDIVVEYVYENPKPYVYGSPAVTDPRNISVVIQHSILLAPEDPIEPRFDDPRVGYFGHQITDLSSTDVTPYRDIIERWRLEKKEKETDLSEPIKPIVFWIENTTPIGLRPIIEKAALRWNESFETAGFKNALQVKTQPDDAEWDAGDIRYNVMRWTSSPDPMFGGYGPSFHDPRSGEILGADIMLEHIVIGYRYLTSDVLGDGANQQTWKNHDPNRCMASLHAHHETLFGMAALDALGADSVEKERLLEEFIYFLILHEIGHTLGLNHNFRSSYLHDLEEIYDTEKTYPVGLYGSVMDYPAVPFAQLDEKQNQYYTTRPGPYDNWAIEFGYRPGLEGDKLKAHLDKSTQPELAFANDADDMRSAGKAIDPRAMINDMTSDPIGFSLDQIKLIKAVQPRFKERLLKEGKSYDYFRNGYYLSLSRLRGALHTVSRYIGGVYIDRAMVGQPNATDPLTPVALADQNRAMKVLVDNLFAPEAFEAFDQMANQLLPQRRGFNHFPITEDPKLHADALGTQMSILNHLLHPKVLARLTDTTLYGNKYTVDQLFSDLTKAIFDADFRSQVNTIRQNLQLDYVDRLLKIVNGNDYDRISQSMALNRLRWIEDRVNPRASRDLQSIAHREHILYRIESGLDPSN